MILDSKTIPLLLPLTPNLNRIEKQTKKPQIFWNTPSLCANQCDRQLMPSFSKPCGDLSQFLKE